MEVMLGFFLVLLLLVCFFFYHLIKRQFVRVLSTAVLFLSVCVIFYALLLPGTAKNRSLFVEASVETESVPRVWDALDDPAIWVNPVDRSESLVLGTDKMTGLYVYDLDGQVLQHVKEQAYNNVDIVLSPWDGGSKSVIVATQRSPQGIAILELDHQDLTVDLRRSVHVDYEGPSGICAYTARARMFLVMVTKLGEIVQYEVAKDYSLVERKYWSVESESEGCVVDSSTGTLYFGEENIGIWSTVLYPQLNEEMTLFDGVDGESLVADVEGLTIWKKAGDKYLIASSQGDNSFAVYDLNAANYLDSFHVSGGNEFDRGVTDTDGIAATGQSLPGFPGGLLVVQDGDMAGLLGRQSFRFIDWRRVMHVLN